MHGNRRLVLFPFPFLASKNALFVATYRILHTSHIILCSKLVNRVQCHNGTIAEAPFQVTVKEGGRLVLTKLRIHESLSWRLFPFPCFLMPTYFPFPAFSLALPKKKVLRVFAARGGEGGRSLGFGLGLGGGDGEEIPNVRQILFPLHRGKKIP